MKVKQFAIWLTANPPEGQLSNHSGFEIQDTGWRAYHVHEESVWEAFVAEGYPDLSDYLKVYDFYTVEATDDMEAYEVSTFNAEASVTELMEAMTNVNTGTAPHKGFVIFTINEVKQMLATEAYQSVYGIAYET